MKDDILSNIGKKNIIYNSFITLIKHEWAREEIKKKNRP
jgi:hypothetical protein